MSLPLEVAQLTRASAPPKLKFPREPSVASHYDWKGLSSLERKVGNGYPLPSWSFPGEMCMRLNARVEHYLTTYGGDLAKV